MLAGLISRRNNLNNPTHNCSSVQIFSYLLRHASDESKLGRGVEREVAAALESVFPRISLKAFINLGAEEKHAQLDELANIVLGIRVFNQHIGKGGVNIPNIEQEAVVLLRQLEVSLSEEVEKAQRICIDLQELIVRSHLQHPEGVTSHMLRRWKDELMNRRQYLSYLQSLQEDMAVSERKVCSLRGTITSEMGDLQELVGNRASVPKEHVYPKFYEIAAQWTGLSHEYKVIIGRTRTMEVLRMFCNSYTPTSHDGIELQGDVVTALEEDALAAEAAVSATMDGSVTTYPGQDPSMEVEAKTGDDASTPSIESNMLTIHDRAHAMLPPETTRRMDRPVKLSIESTPEFMQLPLEYQGFCSWTIVKRQGLLLPGKPELGVVRFKNRFFVFAHQVAINTFMEDPDCFVEGALQRAVLSPELIHLLRLQDSFPDKCITRILQGDTSRKLCPRAAGTVPEKYDASTGTPVHFVAKYFESGYHWNEWVHRRRALQVANLRSCVTKSQQTDVSHFRRANNTQVHLQRAKHTQTSRSNGSKPLQHVRYYAGVPSSQLSKLRRLNLSCAR